MREYLMVFQIVGNRNIVIVFNKIELVDREKVMECYQEIKEFVKGIVVENVLIILILVLYGVNVDVFFVVIEEFILIFKCDLNKLFKMFVFRSFDVNKFGILLEKFVGGVIGGFIVQGKLRVGDEIEIRFGVFYEEYGRIKYELIMMEIILFQVGGRFVEEVYFGGFVGVGIKFDLFFIKGDLMVGNVVGKLGQLLFVWDEFIFEVYLFECVVGIEEEFRVELIKRREVFLFNVGMVRMMGFVIGFGKDIVEFKFQIFVCVEVGDRVVISRQVGSRWRFIGYGFIRE